MSNRLFMILFSSIAATCLFGCVTVKYTSTSATGMATNEKGSKKILKTVREKTYAGIFGKILFTDTISDLSKGDSKKMEKELNRISDLVYKIGNRNWQTHNFGAPVILVPKLAVKLNTNRAMNAFASCDDKNYSTQMSIGLIRRIYLNSVRRAIELQNRQRNDLGNDFTNFKITNQNQYIQALLNLRAKNMSVFTFFSDDRMDDFNESMDAALELQRMSNYISIEFFKGMLFIIGHENYHAITDCDIGKDIEAYADVFSAIIYQLILRDNSHDQDAIIQAFFGNDYSSGSFSTILEFTTGRSIRDIIKDMYANTEFEQGDSTHMTLEERLNYMDTNLNLNNLDEIYSVIGTKILFDYQSKNKK